MIHLLVIALFAAVLSRASFETPALYARLGTGGSITITLGSIVTIWLMAWIIVASLGRRLERKAEGRAIARADLVVFLARIATVVAIVVGVVFLGWLDAVRDVIALMGGPPGNPRGQTRGDLIAIDELLAVAPGLIGISLGWWVMYPIDRFVREATLMRELDSGNAVHAILPRRRWTLQAVRHHLAIVALPITAIVVWSEAVVFAATRWGGTNFVHQPGQIGQTSLGFELGVSAVQMAGAVVVLAVMPVVMCRVWDTVPLLGRPMEPLGAANDERAQDIDDAPDNLHTRLMAHCDAARVRIRGIRVWRTDGSMVNGAVIGLIAPLRYVLLTDALLERLSPRELEAVMAHEVAHIRLRHMPWLVCAVLGAVLPLATMLDITLAAADMPVIPWLETVLAVGVFGAGLFVFGLVSRRFEWQADAYAASRMSEQHSAAADPPTSASANTANVTLMGADAMIAALQRVAQLNHVPTRRRSWRHGSILCRQQRLYALVGAHTGSLPIDRTVSRIKLASAVALLLGLGSVVWSISMASTF
jgi:STE24 endopeptidase